MCCRAQVDPSAERRAPSVRQPPSPVRDSGRVRGSRRQPRQRRTCTPSESDRRKPVAHRKRRSPPAPTRRSDPPTKERPRTTPRSHWPSPPESGRHTGDLSATHRQGPAIRTRWERALAAQVPDRWGSGQRAASRVSAPQSRADLEHVSCVDQHPRAPPRRSSFEIDPGRSVEPGAPRGHAWQ